jgi:hypothetical protein
MDEIQFVKIDQLEVEILGCFRYVGEAEGRWNAGASSRSRPSEMNSQAGSE